MLFGILGAAGRGALNLDQMEALRARDLYP